ncbi:hypothetical protein CE91St58_44550 [Lachnospiraceae bacterium]|nr:hypothetical protein CE91St58_44550 [Lachnospiraceae bacterium]
MEGQKRESLQCARTAGQGTAGNRPGIPFPEPLLGIVWGLIFIKMQKWIKSVKYYCLEKGKKQQESQTIRHISAAQQAVNV